MGSLKLQVKSKSLATRRWDLCVPNLCLQVLMILATHAEGYHCFIVSAGNGNSVDHFLFLFQISVIFPKGTENILACVRSIWIKWCCSLASSTVTDYTIRRDCCCYRRAPQDVPHKPICFRAIWQASSPFARQSLKSCLFHCWLRKKIDNFFF